MGTHDVTLLNFPPVLHVLPLHMQVWGVLTGVFLSYEVAVGYLTIEAVDAVEGRLVEAAWDDAQADVAHM